MHMRPHGGPTHDYMKCSICKEFHVNSPWVLSAGCKSSKNRTYVTTRKTMITNPRWLDKRLFIFLQLVLFLLLVIYMQANLDSLNERYYV